jgi:Icc-related predicted phosphoesterase
MRRFLVCSGVSSRPKSLEWLRAAVTHRQPDGILFAGGVLDSARHYAAQTTTDWGFTHEDALFLKQFFETLGKLRIFSAIIPGPWDTPVEDFLRLGMHAEVEFPDLHVVHATLVEKGDTAILGMGGLLAESATAERDLCSRIMAEYHLRPLWMAKQPHKILLLATPPTGALGGQEGRTLTGDLIDSNHPSLCVVAGPSERRGSQRMASTLVINPGHLAEGWAAWLDWNRPVPDQVELLNLRHLDGGRLGTDTGVGD